MAVTVRGTPGTDGVGATTTASSRTPGITAGTVAGELMVAWCAWNSSAITLTTPPSGWSLIVNTLQTNCNTAAYYRYFVGGDGNPTFGLSGAASSIAACVTFSGALTSGVPTSTSVLGGASSTTYLVPAITPNASTDLLVYLIGARCNTLSTQITISTLPAGGTGGTVTKVLDGDGNISGAVDCLVGLITQQLSAATTIVQGSGTFASTASSMVGIALSLQAGATVASCFTGAQGCEASGTCFT